MVPVHDLAFRSELDGFGAGGAAQAFHIQKAPVVSVALELVDLAPVAVKINVYGVECSQAFLSIVSPDHDEHKRCMPVILMRLELRPCHRVSVERRMRIVDGILVHDGREKRRVPDIASFLVGSQGFIRIKIRIAGIENFVPVVYVPSLQSVIQDYFRYRLVSTADDANGSRPVCYLALFNLGSDMDIELNLRK